MLRICHEMERWIKLKDEILSYKSAIAKMTQNFRVTSVSFWLSIFTSEYIAIVTLLCPEINSILILKMTLML